MFHGIVTCQNSKKSEMGPLNAYVRIMIIDSIISISNFNIIMVTNSGLDKRFSTIVVYN